MNYWTRSCIAVLALSAASTASIVVLANEREDALTSRIDRLALEVQYAEDIAAIKRLQRIYGYYLDKGLWEDLAALFTEDAVANYPAGVYIGLPSIREHLFRNVGGGEMGENGLREGRLYNHMNLQPVVHLHADGRSATGRWRALAMFGGYGGGATWAEGVYEIGYAKENGTWKIRTLDYHAGFGAAYATGWGATPVAGGGGGGRPPLPHPPDRVRDMACEGYPAACIAPFHYANPGTPEGGAVWRVTEEALAALPRAQRPADPAERAADLLHRATLLRDEQTIENLLEIYGYYVDRRMWDHVADLFAEDGSIEMELRGVYVGRARIRQFLELLGPAGLRDGDLNDRAHLQPVVHVASDGTSAWARSREFAMTGVHGGDAAWSEGIYESRFVKQDGVWKFQSLRYYPTFITDYDAGWARDAQPPATASTELPPDRPPSEVYEIYPTPHIPPYHYRNPVSGAVATYPRGAGRPPARAIRTALMPAPGNARRAARARAGGLDLAATITAAEQQVGRAKDYHGLVNLTNAYGYYLDKNLWNDLADLFAEDGSMELAQRGAYLGRERVRGFLFAVFGNEGPVEGRLGNHLQMQPVIHIDPDGDYAQIRSRMMQQLSFGGRPSMGAAVYENEAVKEDGVWKFKSVHAFNTWTASYEDGWARTENRGVPGPSQSYPPDLPATFEFQMFPTVYELPWHYANPVSGRPSGPVPVRHSALRAAQSRGR
jgi:hypothetical protein